MNTVVVLKTQLHVKSTAPELKPITKREPSPKAMFTLLSNHMERMLVFHTVAIHMPHLPRQANAIVPSPRNKKNYRSIYGPIYPDICLKLHLLSLWLQYLVFGNRLASIT